MSGAAEFAGFPDEGLAFLRDLAENNSREWFETHKEVYLRAVQAPALALVASLGRLLEREFPPVSFDTRANGGSLMRIYRDTRFSADKTPYKTNVAMMFSPGGRKRMDLPGFGLQITLEAVDTMAGQFGFGPDQLARYRDAVDSDHRGIQLAGLIDAITAAGEYRLDDPALKRVPRGFDADHPRGQLLRHKGLALLGPPISLDRVRTPGLVDDVMERFRVMAPVWRWLNAAIGA